MTTVKTTSLATAVCFCLAPIAASADSVSAGHIFSGSDGFPTGSLTSFDGMLYETSQKSIVGNTGTIFRVDPATGAERRRRLDRHLRFRPLSDGASRLGGGPARLPQRRRDRQGMAANVLPVVR